jgi:hypothetical protein
MNPNSISHRLFVAALTQGNSAAPKRPTRVAPQREPKFYVPKQISPVGAAAQKLSEWSWSGWQHTTI